MDEGTEFVLFSSRRGVGLISAFRLCETIIKTTIAEIITTEQPMDNPRIRPKLFLELLEDVDVVTKGENDGSGVAVSDFGHQPFVFVGHDSVGSILGQVSVSVGLYGEEKIKK